MQQGPGLWAWWTLGVCFVFVGVVNFIVEVVETNPGTDYNGGPAATMLFEGQGGAAEGQPGDDFAEFRSFVEAASMCDCPWMGASQPYEKVLRPVNNSKPSPPHFLLPTMRGYGRTGNQLVVVARGP